MIIEFKQRRRQQHKQRQKTMIWLDKWGKIIVLHVRQARTSVKFFDVVYQTTVWNSQI